MEVGRQKALVRKAATARKQQQQDGSSALAFKVVIKGTLKRNNDGEDDHPNKKGTGPNINDK